MTVSSPTSLQTAAQLATHLRTLRRAHGLTQAQLGERIGVGQVRIADIEKNPGFKSNVKLLFISYGSRELENPRGGFGGDPKVNTEALKTAGMNTHFYVSPGTAHEWHSWRRSLYQFAQLVFKN